MMMVIRRFLWDDVDDCVLEETDEHGTTLVTYTHEPGPFGPLLKENRGGTKSYYHFDALGSTTMLTDDTGAVTDTFQYVANGNQIARTGTTPTPYTWCGRWGYQDDSATTGGYYIRARSYQPAVARWASVDPIEFLKSDAAYIYGHNSSAYLYDPTGEISVTPISGLNKLGLNTYQCGSDPGVMWDFSLDKPAPCDGFLVQKVSVYCERHKCFAKGRVINDKITNKGAEIVFNYWEAWKIEKGQTTWISRRLPPNSPGSAPGTDLARTTIVDDKRGVYHQAGEIRFYCQLPKDDPWRKKVATGDLLSSVSWPSGPVREFTQCSTSSGDLPRTTKRPTFWEDIIDSKKTVEGPAFRWLQVAWNCCTCRRCPNNDVWTSVDAFPKE